MVEQIVYFTLGFVLCGLIGLAFLPLVSARARRLTLARIEARLPMTFDEIEAERDLLRARFAVEKRALQIEAEQARGERAENSAELGRRAVALMRAQDHLHQTENLLRERDGQLAKSLEFGEKTHAELVATQESLSARTTELAQKSLEYEQLAEAREKLDQHAQELEAALTSARSELFETRERLETTEAARRESSDRAEDLAAQLKALTAAFTEAERRNFEFEARRLRLLAKIAAERQRGDELESVNLSMRRIIAQSAALNDQSATAPRATGDQTVNGAVYPLSPEKDLLDLREAISRIGRQVAHLDDHLDAAAD